MPGALIRRLSAHSSRTSVLVVLAALIVALELTAAITHAVDDVRAGRQVARRPAAPVEAADFDPFATYAMPEALVNAQKVIPRDAVYAFAAGSRLTAVQRQRAALAFELALLPRAFTPDRHKAQWVIAYEMPSEGLGVHYSREIGLGPGVQVVEVSR
jgi:hypothetical protein